MTHFLGKLSISRLVHVQLALSTQHQKHNSKNLNTYLWCVRWITNPVHTLCLRALRVQRGKYTQKKENMSVHTGADVSLVQYLQHALH